MRKIDEIIHQPIRLQLMAALVALRPGEQMEFVWLRDLLAVTDGNLGAHLAKLEGAEDGRNRLPRLSASAKSGCCIGLSATQEKEFAGALLY